uniref:Uncharacterized protein n=1 Tax=viral metagenome TaxID=1070528 RepID=A0A6C0H347_9ZZZZ
MKNSYRSLSNFGSNDSPANHPLTYCIGNDTNQRFLHGSSMYGAGSDHCHRFMSDYCASGWDAFCELESRNEERSSVSHSHNSGRLLIANTAARKYLVNMHNATEKYEPFDPTVANSPMIRYWVSNSDGGTIPEYAVDASTIDNDVLMDKILADPNVAMNILINIYNTMKRKDTLSSLKGTKIGAFYNSHPFFKERGGV